MKFDINSLRDSSLLALYEMRDRLQLDPIYQRPGGVWSPKKRQLLIDSLLNKFDIAKFYLHSLPQGSGRYDFAIIDGKQRFEAIWKFMENGFPLGDDFVFFEDETVIAKGMTYSELAKEYPKLISRLHSRVMDVSVVYADDPDLVEDMFSRLNEAVPLNAAEKRNALGGPITPLIRRLVTHRFFTRCVPIRNTRYRHYDIAVKLLYLEDSEKIVDTKRSSLDLFVEGYAKHGERDPASLESKTRRILDSLEAIFVDRDPLLRSSSAIPVYYVLFSKLIEKAEAGAFSRKALEEFEAVREQNRELLSSEESEKIDPRLIEYDELAQSSNDSASIKTRYEILREFLGYPVPVE